MCASALARSAMSIQESNPLGPLATLVGTWEGGAGTDIAPAEPNRKVTATSRFRERTTFEPIGLVDNHEQTLCGLRYLTVAWRIGQADAFHQDTGYWLWDAKNEQEMRAFVVPRGVTILAGGKAAADAKAFDLVAERGAALADGRLVTVLEPWCPPIPGLCLWFPANRHMPASLRALIDLMKERGRCSLPRGQTGGDLDFKTEAI